MFVCSLFTEILDEIDNCNDIQFSENGSWTSIRSKTSSSKTVNSDQNSSIHTIAGSYFINFFSAACKNYCCNITREGDQSLLSVTGLTRGNDGKLAN